MVIWMALPQKSEFPDDYNKFSAMPQRVVAPLGLMEIFTANRCILTLKAKPN